MVVGGGVAGALGVIAGCWRPGLRMEVVGEEDVGSVVYACLQGLIFGKGGGIEHKVEMNDLENVILVVWLGWQRARWLCEKALESLVCLGK